MLVWYVGECMVSIINIKIGRSKNLPLSIPNYSANQLLTFSRYSVKVRDSLYTTVIIWVNITLNHIDTRTILPR